VCTSALALAALAALLSGSTASGRGLQADQADPQHERAPAASQGSQYFDEMLERQADTDRAWREASAGYMRMDKILYRSRADGLEIPAFVFQPLTLSGPGQHPGLVWVHENIRGHLYEHYIPYIREATSRGYIVIAPEYRGSIGYGKAFYDAIDYGGAEVDDVVTAVDVLVATVPDVDPARVGIIGWSHGGMIALLAIFRNPTTFAAAGAIVPVANLFDRLALKGIERQRRAIDPHNRFGGTPFERPEAYRERSPVFHVDKLTIPLLVHVAGNDDDVTIEEGMQVVDALRTKKPHLSTTKVYDNPAGRHLFDRQVELGTWKPRNTPEQADSWGRVWDFFGFHLDGTFDAALRPEPRPAVSQAYGSN
jgi:dienelactone hydrolase